MPPPLPPRLTPEEQAAAKERRDRRNVNITLYTACLLLVAAASLFIGAALPVTARVAGLAVVVVLFYGGGLVVHAVSRTLRPAATAFTGTGLALLPVTGIALDVLVLGHPTLSWLITSLLGTIMMVVAAVRLDSRVVAYLTVPFLLSTVMASGASVQRGMVWALIATIALAVLMAWLSAVADGEDGAGEDADGEIAEGELAEGARNRWLPAAYREAIARTHQWITPGAVLASLVLGVWLSPTQMLLLLLAACAYYATVAVIGPRRFRLAAAYAVRGGLLMALLAWASMLDWSLSTTLVAMVAYLCLQIPLVWWARPAAAGYLPTGTAALADHGVSWALAGMMAFFDLEPGLGWPALIVLGTTAVTSVGLVRRQTPVPPALWQLATPFSALPLLVQSTLGIGTERPWHLEIAAGTVLLVEVVVLLVLRRDGHRDRTDARIAPHGIAAAAVALSFLLAERWTDDVTTGLLVGVWALLAWATVTAVTAGHRGWAESDGWGEPDGRAESDGWAESGAARLQGSLSPGVSPRFSPGQPRWLSVGVWTGASLLALLVLLTLDLLPDGTVRVSGELVAWYGAAVVTAGVALWWACRGPRDGGQTAADAPAGAAPRAPAGAPAAASALSADPAHPAHPARLLVLAVGAVVLLATSVRLAGMDWHGVAALVLLTGWLVATALLTRGRLPRGVRAGTLLAGQGAAAVLVATVTDLLGGDGSAARAAAAVSLAAGMTLRRRWGARAGSSTAGASTAGGSAAGPATTGPAPAGPFAGEWSAVLAVVAVALLWLVELGVGADRAALMVIAAVLAVAGAVLGASAGGHWAVLCGLPALVVAASPWLDLRGGWLPEALVPTAVAIALLVLLILAVLAREIAASVRGTAPAEGPWWADPAVFRPAAIGLLGVLSLVLGLTGDVDGSPHAGGLAMTMAAGALAGHVLARTRGIDWLVLTTVVGVPWSLWLLTHWWQDRGLPFPDGDWRAVGSAVVGLAVLGAWAVLDARGVDGVGRSGAGRSGAVSRGLRPGILWQGGLAAVLVTAGATVLDIGRRAGMPEDAVVWVSLAAGAVAGWLTVEAWGRTLLWPGDPVRWQFTGHDAAVVLTWAAASRAWWQRAQPDHVGQAGWWTVQTLVLVLVGLGFWHVLRARGAADRPEQLDRPDRSVRARWCFLAAAAVFTLAALYVLVDGTATMQLAVLLGFGLLVVLGLTRGDRVLTWWGAGGVALSVLWYLRGYTYVYLALLGLVLIVLAVWQLRRHQSR